MLGKECEFIADITDLPIVPGGLLCFSIRFMDYPSYKAKLSELEVARKWKLAHHKKVPYKMNEQFEEIYLLVYKRT